MINILFTLKFSVTVYSTSNLSGLNSHIFNIKQLFINRITREDRKTILSVKPSFKTVVDHFNLYIYRKLSRKYR